MNIECHEVEYDAETECGAFIISIPFERKPRKQTYEARKQAVLYWGGTQDEAEEYAKCIDGQPPGAALDRIKTLQPAGNWEAMLNEALKRTSKWQTHT